MDGLFSLLLALFFLIAPGNGNQRSNRRNSPPPPDQNLPVGKSAPPIPSPALLPGAIAFGAALLKKKRQEAEG